MSSLITEVKSPRTYHSLSWLVRHLPNILDNLSHKTMTAQITTQLSLSSIEDSTLKDRTSSWWSTREQWAAQVTETYRIPRKLATICQWTSSSNSMKGKCLTHRSRRLLQIQTSRIRLAIETLLPSSKNRIQLVHNFHHRWWLSLIMPCRIMLLR